jgi:hypothetical protein
LSVVFVKDGIVFDTPPITERRGKIQPANERSIIFRFSLRF